MNILSRVLFAVVSLICISQRATAQINVEYLNGSAWAGVAGFPVAAGSNITINDSASYTYRVYTNNSSTQSIGTITLSISSSGSPTLLIGTGATGASESTPLTAGALNVGAISYSGGTPILQTSVNGDMNGNITFWHIMRIDAVGSVTGNVVHDASGTSPPRLGVINAFDIGTSLAVPEKILAKYGDIYNITASHILYSNIDCDNGNIDTVQAGPDPTGTYGYVASGHIRALKGSIGTVKADGGWIGTGPNPNFAKPVIIEAKNGITLVEGTGYVRANIVANAGGGLGDLGGI